MYLAFSQVNLFFWFLEPKLVSQSCPECSSVSAQLSFPYRNVKKLKKKYNELKCFNLLEIQKESYVLFLRVKLEPRKYH